MRRRLIALLLVAAVSGSIAGTVSANQRTTVPARTPLALLVAVGQIALTAYNAGPTAVEAAGGAPTA